VLTHDEGTGDEGEDAEDECDHGTVSTL
jgi:hypothetical protein